MKGHNVYDFTSDLMLTSPWLVNTTTSLQGDQRGIHRPGYYPLLTTIRTAIQNMNSHKVYTNRGNIQGTHLK